MKFKNDYRALAGSLVLAVGATGALATTVYADTTTTVDGSENHYQQQPKGSTIEYGGLKYSVLSNYVAQDHEVVSWELRALVGTKSAQVGVFTDQLQPGQYLYTGATPNHTVLTDSEWTKVTGTQSTYGDLTVRVGTRYLDDASKNGADLQTGVLHYVSPEYLSGIKVDTKMAAAGSQADTTKGIVVTANSDDSGLIKSGYSQGDTDGTTADKTQLQQLMALVKQQANTNATTGSSTGNTLDFSKITNVGVDEGPNGFYTYDATTKQLKFVVYNLEQVKADADIIASVIKTLGGSTAVENATPATVASAAADAGATSDVVAAIKSADALTVTSDNALLALNFTNLYMHDIRIMVPVAVTAGHVIPNQFDFAGATWDGTTLGDVSKFTVSDTPDVIVPGGQTATTPTTPTVATPYKNVLASNALTLLNGYNFYGKTADDTIVADSSNESKSGEAAFSTGSPLNFSQAGTYTVKAKAVFAPGVYVVRSLDGKAISAAVDGTVVKNGELVSVSAGSVLKILSGSGKFQLIDATAVFAKAASAQAIANVAAGKTSKVLSEASVKGKDSAVDALLSSASTGSAQWTWVVSQNVGTLLDQATSSDVKLVDDLSQDTLVSLKIVDTANPTKVIKDITDEAKQALTTTNKTVADGLAAGKSAENIKDSDGLQLSKNLLVYKLSDYTTAKYGKTVSFAITVSGAMSTDHKNTAAVQLYKNGKALTVTPQASNSVKIITAQPQTVAPTNPVQPTTTQTTGSTGTPSSSEAAYTPATTATASRVNTPVSEALGDVANNSSTSKPVQSLAATGAYLASNLWFLILFPIAVLGTLGEMIYKKRTGTWFTVRTLKQLIHAKRVN